VTRRLTTTEQGYGWAWQQRRLRILQRDGYICHWCGGRARSVDHVVPKIEGGSDDPANLVASCVPCNSARSLAWVRRHRGGGGGVSADRGGRAAVGAGARAVDATASAFFERGRARLRSPGDHGRIQPGPAGSGPAGAATGVLAAVVADRAR
jgi:hypothetical protein